MKIVDLIIGLELQDGTSSMQEAALSPAVTASSEPFVGKWQTLVSQTNWEKGRIIKEWRDSLRAAGMSGSEFSDEAWTQLVGGVSPQHVGRLRRVHERFGESQRQFAGLYWSHFLSALDWQDAEMWLEGAVQSRWSVSQMRRQRAETLGLIEPESSSANSSSFDEDAFPQWEQIGTTEPIDQDYEESQRVVREHDQDDTAGAGEMAPWEPPQASETPSPDQTAAVVTGTALPEDLQEAAENLKLAILRHQMAGWLHTTPEQVLAMLDRLKALVMANAP